jgi:hypothetical protein
LGASLALPQIEKLIIIMPIYIIRPKISLISQYLDLINRKLTSESRQRQTQEVEAVYQENSDYQSLIQTVKIETLKVLFFS